jgi:hypothetical protein
MNSWNDVSTQLTFSSVQNSDISMAASTRANQYLALLPIPATMVF